VFQIRLVGGFPDLTTDSSDNKQIGEGGVELCTLPFSNCVQGLRDAFALLVWARMRDNIERIRNAHDSGLQGNVRSL